MVGPASRRVATAISTALSSLLLVTISTKTKELVELSSDFLNSSVLSSLLIQALQRGEALCLNIASLPPAVPQPAGFVHL